MDRSKEIVKALVQEVTAKAKLNKAIVEYYDLDRVHFKIEEQGYAIRMWNIHQVGKKIFIRWTLFKLIDNHGEEICDGEFTWIDNK